MMIRRMAIMLLVAVVIFGGIFGFQAFKNRMIQAAMAGRTAPIQTVSTIQAATSEWQAQLQAVGTARANNGADLSFEVAGIVEKIAFQSGQDVAAGTLLVQLRADQDIATLQQLQATADNAEITYNRDLKQLKINGISQATVDSDLATLKSARAQVAAQQATIDKKSIKAPFAGRLGIRQVDLGQYLNAGTTVVTLQALDPIHVDFTLPQQALAQIRVGQAVTAAVDTYPDRAIAGTITAISPLVNSTSRNIQVRATFTNPDRLLMPGMYAKVTIAVGEKQRYITLPRTAIVSNPYGDIAFIVTDKGKGPNGQPRLVVTQTFVTTGESRGDQISVLKGLEVGQTVVTTGQLKLQNGSPVTINNTVTPPNDATVAPKDPS